MGWAKHPDAVNSHRAARSEAYVSVKKLAKEIRLENEGPDDIYGHRLLELAYALHHELRRFVKLRAAVGGQEEVNIQPYIKLLLTFIPSFKWSVHVR